MSKYPINIENIPRGIVAKKYSNLLTPSGSIKVELEWLRNYLRPFAAQSQKSTQIIKPNLLKKNTTRRLLKTKNKTIVHNQNKNDLNCTNFGILSNHTIVKKIDDHELFQALNEHRRRNSCQLLRNNRKQAKFRHSREYLPKRKDDNKLLVTTLQPWQSQEIMDGDIVGYMFNHQR